MVSVMKPKISKIAKIRISRIFWIFHDFCVTFVTNQVVPPLVKNSENFAFLEKNNFDQKIIILAHSDQVGGKLVKIISRVIFRHCGSKFCII